MTKRWGESGNVFFTLFGAVALVGVVGAATSTLMRGPVGTVVSLNQRAKADSQMQIAMKLAMLEAQNSAIADCDNDTLIEPLPPGAALPGLTNGGQLPSVGSTTNDPWGVAYGYCSWDHGVMIGDPGCPVGLRAGENNTSGPVIAIISAGPDRTFGVTCHDQPSADYLTRGASGADDIVVQMTYAEANEASGGLWHMKSGNPDQITTGKELDVQQGAQFSSGNVDFTGSTITGTTAFDTNAALDLSSGGLFMLPDETMLVDSECDDPTDNINSGLLRRFVGGGGEILQICDAVTNPLLPVWTDIGGAGGAVAAGGANTEVQFNAGGVLAATPDFTWSGSLLDITGSGDFSNDMTVGDELSVGGLADLNGDLDVAGATNLAGTLDVSGVTDINNNLNVTGNTDLGGTFNADGVATLGSTLAVTGDASFTAQALGSAGSAALPSFSFSGSSNTGIYYTSSGLGFSIGGTNEMTLTSSGLEVSDLTVLNNISADRFLSDMAATSAALPGFQTEPGTGIFSPVDNSLALVAGGTTRLIIDGAGDVGIGVASPEAMLDVGGEIKVGTSAAACGVTLHGAIRYVSGDLLQVCSSMTNNWEDIGTSGGGGSGASDYWTRISVADPRLYYTDDFVGVGTNDPLTTFHVNGDFLTTGSYTGTASMAVSGAGTRMFFDPESGAFRAGTAFGTEWDNANLGNRSLALGNEVLASGAGAAALGNQASATGANSFAFGLGVTGGGANPLVSGARSYGIFMGSQPNIDLQATNTLGLLGGRMLIDQTPAINPAVSGTLSLDVEGGVGAVQYCDEDGTNCFTAASVATGGVGAPGNDREVIYNSGGVLGTNTNFVFTSAGRMGIGTNAPTAGLDVRGNAVVANLAGTGTISAFGSGDGSNYSNIALLDSATNRAWSMTHSQTIPNAMAFGYSNGLGGYLPTMITMNNGRMLFGSSGTIDGSLHVDVEGDVGATAYCDEFGLNCFDAADVANAELAYGADGQIQYASAGRLWSSPNYNWDNATSTLNVTGNETVTGTLDLAGNGAMIMPRGATADRPGAPVDGMIRYNSTNGKFEGYQGGAWQDILTSAVAGGAAAPDRGIQFNSGGSFAASSDFVFTSSGDFMVYQTMGGPASVSMPVSGQGYRLTFDAQSGAFRAGVVTGTQWNDVNSGLYSGAIGYNNIASGLSSFAAGNTNTASGTAALALGNANTAPDNYDIAIGNSNTTAGGQPEGIAIGAGNTSSQNGSVAIGRNNVSSGYASVAMGSGAQATASEAFAVGEQPTASGDDSIAFGYMPTASGISSMAFGQEVKATGTNAMAIGLGNQTAVDANRPQVSGTNSLGVFMGAQTSVNLAANSTMALLGGQMVIDPRVPAQQLAARSVLDLGAATDSVVLPSGSTAQRPGVAIDGMIRYNSENGRFEGYQAGAWQDILTGSALAAAPDRGIQFNSGGNFAANSNFVYSSQGALMVSGVHTGIGAPPVEGAGTRMFFDPTKGAFRAGQVIGTEWDNANVGSRSSALGYRNRASGSSSFAVGENNVASGTASVAIGIGNTAGGVAYSTVIGNSSTATGIQSTAIGGQVVASNTRSMALGSEVEVSGLLSMGLGLNDGGGTDFPKVSGTQSLGIFMGDHSSVDFTPSQTMGIFGGQMVIDPRVPASNLSADTALEVEGTIKMAYGGEACDAAREGAIHYDSASNNFYVCKTAGAWDLLATGTPAAAAPDRGIQFNSGGNFAADANLVYTSQGNLVMGGLTNVNASVQRYFAAEELGSAADAGYFEYRPGAAFDVLRHGFRGATIDYSNSVPFPSESTVTIASSGFAGSNLTVGAGVILDGGASSGVTQRGTIYTYEVPNGASRSVQFRNITGGWDAADIIATKAAGNNHDGSLEINAGTNDNQLFIGGIGATSGLIGLGTDVPQADLDIARAGSVLLPRGATAQRPGTPVNGMIRYNSENGRFEGYQAGAWQDILTGSALAAAPDRGIQFNSGGSFAADSNFIFTSLGTLGVGTDTPRAVIHAHSATNQGNIAVSSDNLSTVSALDLYSRRDAPASSLSNSGSNKGWSIESVGDSGFFGGYANYLFIRSQLHANPAARNVIASFDGVNYRVAFGNNGAGSTPRATLDVLGTDSVVLPAGSTAQRPGAPVNGMIRYNSENGKFEGYQAGAWQDILTSAVAGGASAPNRGVQFNSGGSFAADAGFTYSSTGYLGLGTANPVAELDVAGTGAVALARGTTAERPSSPVNGMIRYNSTSSRFEGYQAGVWTDIVTGAAVSSFVSLTDTPASYAGVAGQFVRVNSGETGLEFTDSIVPSVAGLPAPLQVMLDDLGDVSAASPNDNDIIRFNSASGLWETASVGSLVAGAASPDRGIQFNSGGEFAADANFTYSSVGYLGLGTGSPVAELDVAGTGAVALARGTTAERPVVPVNGMIRYNNQNGKFEGYQAGAWQDILTSAVAGGAAAPDRGVQFNSGGSFAADSGFVFTSQGALVISGSYTGAGTEPISGAGTRMFFDPGKSAFRAGTVSADQWNFTSTGDYSFATGFDTLASGESSVAMGAWAQATGSRSVAIGDSVQATNYGTVALGAFTSATGNTSVAIGNFAQSTNDQSVSIGAGTIASGAYSLALGNGLEVSGLHAAGLGLGSSAVNPVMSGDSSFGIFMGDQDSVVFSSSNTFGLFGGQMVIDPRTPAQQLTARSVLDLGAATDSVVLPSGATAQRPGAPVNGMIRYNSENGKFEGYQAGAWQDILTSAVAGGASAPNRGVQFNSGGSFAADSGFTYSSAGYLGLGTANPVAELDVAGTGAVALARGTTAERPSSPVNGMIRYNSTSSRFEGYQAGAWTDIVTGAAVSSFVSLTDTPASYAGVAGQFVRVNNGETGLEFTDQIVPSVSGQPAPALPNLDDLGDVSAATPNGNDIIRFNSASGQWEAASIGSLVAGAASPDRGIQFNSGGSFAANSNFVYTSQGTFMVSGMHTGTGASAVSGAGTRMFFDPSKSALRAGAISGTEWDNANIGIYSVALGSNTLASASRSFAMGHDVSVSGMASAAFGESNTVTGTHSFSTGVFNNVGGSMSVAMGLNATASGNSSAAIGGPYVTASGHSSLAFGNRVRTGDGLAGSSGNSSVIFGLVTGAPALSPQAQVTGNQSFAVFMGDHNGVTFSSSNTFGLFGGQMVIDPRTPAQQLTARSVLDLGAATDSVVLPSGTTAQRPSVFVNGMLRYNSETGKFEGYQAGAWQDIITGAAGGSASAPDRGVQFNSGGNFAADANFTYTSMGYLGVGTASPVAELDVAGTGAVALARGTTAERPAAPVDGMIRYNATSGKFEGYQGGIWTDIVTGAAVSSFVSLTDTPASYAGSAGYFLKVNPGESGVIFSSSLINTVSGVAAPTGMNFDHLDDVSAASPNDNDIIRFNSASGLWETASIGSLVAGASAPDRGIQFNSGGALSANANFTYSSAGYLGLGTGSPVAELDVAGTGAVALARGTTAERPGTPVNGMIRYNATNSKFEGYQGGAWTDIVTGAAVSSFVSLTDTPASYAGSAGYFLKVNPGESGVSFSSSLINIVGGAPAPTGMNLDNLDDVNVPTPNAGQVLSWDGSEWIADDVTVAPGAPDRGIQFNSGNTFAADANLTYTSAGRLGVGTAAPQVMLDVAGEGRFGSTNATCNMTIRGAMRFESALSRLEMCDGAAWVGIVQNQPSAVLVISPSANNSMNVAFDGVNTPTLGTTYNFTVQNVGNINTSALTTSLTGDTANFDITANTCTAAVLTPSGSCTVTVRPKASGNNLYRATLSVPHHNAPTAALEGQGTGFGCAPGVLGGGGVYVSCGAYNLVAMPGGCADDISEPTCSGNDVVNRAWGSEGKDRPNVESTTNGPQNTVNLKMWADAEGTGSHPAAEYCRAMVKNGFSDWYLPANDELQLMYNNRVALGGWAVNAYQSSTEYNGPYAWYIDNGGTFQYTNKGNAGIRIRCVRRETQALPSPQQDTVADRFYFAPVMTTTSNRVSSSIKTIAGISTSVAVTLSNDTSGGAAFKINGGAEVTSGNVSSGDTLQLVMTAPGSAGNANTVDVVVGTGAATRWKVAVPNETGTRRIFIRSIGSGNFGGVVTADNSCQTTANAAGLTGTWKAIISDRTLALDFAANRLDFNWDTVTNMNGELVASSWNDLWDGTISNPINRDVNNNILNSTRVYTGSNSSGIPVADSSNNDCSSWVDPNYYSRAGNTSTTGWTDTLNVWCYDSGHIYCFENTPSAGDTTPSPFEINPMTYQTAAGNRVNSPIITISGIDTSVSVGVSGAGGNPKVKINGGAEVDNGTVNNGETVQFVMTAPATNGQRNKMTITVGAYTTYWYVGAADTAKTKRIFVTSTTHTGNLGGIGGADATCQARATGAGLTGTWKSVLSTKSNADYYAVNRASVDWGTLVNMNNEVVANSWNDFWDGTIQNPINRDQSNNIVSTTMEVWTGTDSNGRTSSSNGDCNGWTDGNWGGSISTTWGNPGSVASSWTSAAIAECPYGKRLYCIETTDFSPGSTPSPGGNRQVIYNDGGSLNGDPDFEWTNTSNKLSIYGSLSFTSANGYISLPSGTTAQRPSTAANGMLRYNSESGKFEGYQGGTWEDIITSAASTSAAAPDRGIQFNSGGTFAADANFTYTSAGYLGIGTANPNVVLDVIGDVEYTGVLTDVSDRRLKDNIISLGARGSMLDKLAMVETFSFTMKGDKTQAVEFGVMAQDIRKVFPELVREDQTSPEHYLSVNYIGMIAPIIEATKELKAENDALRTELAALRSDREQMVTALNDLTRDVQGLKAHTGYGIDKAMMGLGMVLGMLAAMAGSGLIIVVAGIIRRRHHGTGV